MNGQKPVTPAATKAAEKPAKEQKPTEPSVAGKISCTKCGAVKGASKDRYLKLLMKKAGLEYENDEQAIKALGGIGSQKYTDIEKRVKAEYLCRVCRPKPVKAPKAEKPAKTQ